MPHMKGVAVAQEYKLFVGGEWRVSSRKMEVKNPYNGEVVGLVNLATEEIMEEALSKADTAFHVTKSLPAYERSKILADVSSKLAERRADIARIMSLESGKPIKDAEAEVDRAIFTFKVASSEAERFGGDLIPMDLIPGSEGRIAILRRFPIGPTLGICPFNFPLNLVVHKVAPALAVGNPIIIKPASATPLTSLKLAEIAAETSLPPGGASFLPCPSSLAERVLQDDRIKKFTFTGSSDVGWRLKELVPKKKVTLELGGNAALIVHSDGDLSYAIPRAVYGAFYYAGQSCISIQRIFVHQDIFDEFTSEFLKRVGALKVGDPLDRNTDVGPMIDETAAKRAEEWIGEAVEGGAEILIGGRRERNILEPTVLTQVKPDMKVSCQEVFAPVVTLDPYSSFEEVIRLVNSSPYGLQAGLFTRDLERILYAYREIEVGGVIINDVPTYRVDHMPYGGMKDSGFGREGVKYAMEEMTEPKLLVLRV